MSVEMLTYAALGAHLKSHQRRLVRLLKRLGLPRSLSLDGKALVSVDLAEIRHTPRPPSTGQAGNIALLTTTIERLQAEITRLETMVANHRTDFERERERADRLMVELLQARHDLSGDRVNAFFECSVVGCQQNIERNALSKNN